MQRQVLIGTPLDTWRNLKVIEEGGPDEPRKPGFGWTLSEETKRILAEIDANSRQARVSLRGFIIG